MEDLPFKADEVRFWSLRTFPKFLVRGLPRLLIIFIGYIIIFLISLTFSPKNQAFTNKMLKYSTRLKMYFFGYKTIDISKEDLNIIRNTSAQIIIANHSSYMDILLMSYIFPEAKFIASKYIGSIPVIKNFGRTKCIYLTNEFGGNLTDLIQEELNSGTKIIFFSEGVCCRSDILLKLRNGAFVPNMEILPIHIDYGKNYWVMGEQDMVLHAMTQISNHRNRVTVRALPSYKPTNSDKNDIELFKENFRKYYGHGFGVSLSEKSYKDHPYFRLKL